MKSTEFRKLSVASGGLWKRKDPQPVPLETVDAVIFDVDGVLVEVSGSFRHVISQSVQFYFNRILEVPGEERLVSGEETGLFKLAGNFNNDWDVTKGAVAYGLMKLMNLDGVSDKNIEHLRKKTPALEEFTEEIKNRGGGLRVTLEIIREKLGKQDFSRFTSLYRPDLIRQLFLEHYAGSGLCRALYGFDPRYAEGPGLIERERDIVDVPLLRKTAANGIALGILSGRIPSEAEYLFRKNGMDSLLNPDFVVTDDGSLPSKPDPAGLSLLARKMGFQAAIYVGDVPDDWTTVSAYNSQSRNTAPIACCMVQTGAVSDKLISLFYEESGVDYVAADVNCLLKALLLHR
ncbi:MAG TPA: HAD family hydrolase [archaeon]|nr:HAD family hydrolase [archaeon]